MVSRMVTVSNPSGFHIRPAGVLVKAVSYRDNRVYRSHRDNRVYRSYRDNRVYGGNRVYRGDRGAGEWSGCRRWLL